MRRGVDTERLLQYPGDLIGINGEGDLGLGGPLLTAGERLEPLFNIHQSMTYLDVITGVYGGDQVELTAFTIQTTGTDGTQALFSKPKLLAPTAILKAVLFYLIHR